jgi:hypothetical protein
MASQAPSGGGTLRTLGRAALVVITGLSLSAPLLGAEITGAAKREIFRSPGAGEPNANPPTFANPNYPNTPDETTFLDTFSAPQSANPNVEDYLSKMTCYIHPQVTGDYVFFFSSDDHGALYLSTDDSPSNLKLIAQETNWSDPLKWTSSGGSSDLTAKRSDQFTGTTWPGGVGAPIHLVSGKKYYAVAFDKEGGGGDNTSVTMLLAGDVAAGAPSDGDVSTLTGNVISVDAPDATAISRQPLSQTIVQGRPVSFTAKVTVLPADLVQDGTLVVPGAVATGSEIGAEALHPGVTYQWQRNGVNVPLVDVNGDGIADDGSDSETYTIDPVAAGDNGAKFHCVIKVGAKTLTSADAVLTVNSDNVPPTFVATGGDANPADALTTVTLTFNEKMDTNTLNAATYKISGGITVSAANVASPTVVILTTSKQAENTPYTATVTGAKDIAGNALTPNTASFSSLAFKTGVVNYQRWDNISVDVDAFVTDSFGTLAASEAGVLSQFYYPQTSPNLDNFVSHLAGYFIPPATGDYVFFFSSDDHGVLYLSTDDSPANKQEIARETSWSNAGNWATSDNGSADLDSKRSDKCSTSTWPTGATISLTKGKKYYIESFAKEGGGGDDNTATFKLASDADPANGSTALKGDAVGTYVDLSTLPPVITQRPQGVHFNKGDSVTFSVTVDSPKPVSYQWYQSKKPVANATNATLTIPNAGPGAVGDYYVVATSVNGSVSSYPDDDARAIMNGAFVIEMEDYNYGGGKSVPAASVMPPAPSLYYGLDGLPGIDFHLANQSTSDPTANGNVYRNGYKDTNGVTVDFPTAPEALGNVDVLDDGGNGDRGDITIAQNHKIGWGDTGEWYQYTRDFPPGVYNVVLGAGLDGRAVDALGAQLQIVTGDITKVNAATNTVGALLSDGTGAWSSDDYILFKDPSDASKLAEVTLNKNTTVRAYMSAGGYDFDFLMFYKIRDIPTDKPLISIGADGKITFTGTLQGASDPAGPYTPVAGATSPFTPDRSAAAQKYYRSSN